MRWGTCHDEAIGGVLDGLELGEVIRHGGGRRPSPGSHSPASVSEQRDRRQPRQRNTNIKEWADNLIYALRRLIFLNVSFNSGRAI